MGRYRLDKRLGGGGMGQVFLGRSPGGRPVAVKLVRPELAEDLRFRERFTLEVEAARKVGGFYTAQVVDADTDAHQPWLVSAYVPGPSLNEAVLAHGPLPGSVVAVLAAGLAEGLNAIHTAGLVHRDLKPGNVLLAADGPRVIDFGIARALDVAHHSTSIVGTPAFMSPEQGRGEPVGPQSDVFSLGSVLAFAATGASPFGTGPAHAIIYRIVHGRPDLSGLDVLPAHLADLITACLNTDPAQRPTLTAILDGLSAPSGATLEWLPHEIAVMIAERGAVTGAAPTRALTAHHEPGSLGPALAEIPSAGSPRDRRLKFAAMAVIPLLAAGGITAATLLMKDAGAGDGPGSKVSPSPTNSTSHGTASAKVPRVIGPTTGVAINAEPYCTIQSNYTGGYLGAVSGGGLLTGALQLGTPIPDTWERFKLVSVPSDDPPAVYYAIQTAGGNFITIVGGDTPTGEIHTDSTTTSGWEELELVPVNEKGLYAIRTRYGYYLSGVNGGGGLPGDPVSTTSRKIGPRGVWRIVCGLSEAQS